MEEKKIAKIRLSTVLLGIIIIILIAGIAFLMYQNNILRNENGKKAEDTHVAQTETELPKLEENEELKNFLSHIAYLNDYKDTKYKLEDGVTEEDYYTNEKIMVTTRLAKLVNDTLTYNPEEIKEAVKEIFGEDINVEEFIKTKNCGIEYDSKTNKFSEGAGDLSCIAYFVKFDSQNNTDGIYEITFLYSHVGEGNWVDNTAGDCDCFKTTIKVKVNDNYKYSKYQLVSTNYEGEKIGKLKDYDNTINQN